jgi:hypothetical protein
MFDAKKYKVEITSSLQDAGIHETQVSEGFGFDKMPNVSAPGVFWFDRLVPQVDKNFRLLNRIVRNDINGPYSAFTSQGVHFVARRPQEALDILPAFESSDLDEIMLYLQKSYRVAREKLVARKIEPTTQAVATLIALASYGYPREYVNAILPLPGSIYLDNIFGQVYYPYLRVGASLSMIVAATLHLGGKAMSTEKLLGFVPVRLLPSEVVDYKDAPFEFFVKSMNLEGYKSDRYRMELKP